MNYLRNEKRKTKTIFVVFAASVVVAIIYYGGGGIAKWSSGKAVSVSAGMFQLKFPFSEKWGEFVANFRTKENLHKENAELKESVARLSVELNNQKLIIDENARLKEILGRSTEKEIILARVLAKPNMSLYDTLVIDVGLDDKIKEGDLVSVSQSVIGTVARVSTGSSKVKLFSSPGEEVSVNIGEKNIPAIAYGLGAGNFEIKLPKESEVKEGDIVSSPENGADIVGTVGVILKKDSDAFQKILVKSPINTSELGWVLIIKSNKL